ncbi:MAG: ABC transporter ATP-binding protein [Candidatus Colwellbacteria bacterium]|nr:ABC transporter ATP-binding protein [Candidatus Colwellbacteria bacterium]
MKNPTSNKGNSRETLGLFLEAALRYKALIVVLVISVLFASGSGVIIPLYFKKFFDLMTGGGAKTDLITGLMGVLIALIILKAIEWVAWRVSSFAVVSFETRVMADLNEKCFAYLHGHSFGYFNNNFVGSMVKRVKSFANAFEMIADNVLWEVLPFIVSISAILFVLWGISPLLGWGVIAWIILYTIISLAFSKFKLKYDIRRNEAETFASGLLADTITNNANVKLFNGYDREVSGFTKATEDLRAIRKKSWNMGNVFEAVQGVMAIGLEIGMLYIAVSLWKNDGLTPGDFVLIQAYLSNIFGKVWGFGRVIRRFYESLSDASEMTDILLSPHEIKDVPNAADLKVSEGKIDFKNVDFRYGDSRRILSGFSLSIAKGEKVALIGPSGAGKTTVVKLLLRMHDLTGGSIEIDGQNISEVTQESLWRNVSLVPQDPILFHRTLIDNIRYGRPDASDDEVIEAAKSAHCHDFIMATPDGYDTFVGERGVKLSGGERQRVAIARAILRNAPILVLDEATSSLDSGSESLIQDALNGLMEGKTVIVIAHRLSTIRRMDRIIVMADGGIIEEGSHDVLSERKDGMYRKLWELQAGGFIK